MAVVAFLLAFLAGFLIAGYRMAARSGCSVGLGSARRVSAWPPGNPAGSEVAETRGRLAPVTAPPRRRGALAMLAAHLPPPRGPGAVARTASTSQVHRSAWAMARPRGRPAQGLLGEPDCAVLQVEPADVRPPRQVEIQPKPRPGPPQPQRPSAARLGRDAFDLDAKDGAAHDRPSAAAVAGVALFGMAALPRR